jgi:hypothetical protein
MENPKITIWPYFSASSSKPSISVFFKQKRTTFHNRSTKLLYRSNHRRIITEANLYLVASLLSTVMGC